MPEELTMQKYWPTQEAVAKLRHEAAMSEIKKAAEIVRSNSEVVRSISDRLDKMERSSVSTPPAPVWVPGFWIEPAASVRPSRSIPVPFSEAAASSPAQDLSDTYSSYSGAPMPIPRWTVISPHFLEEDAWYDTFVIHKSAHITM